MKMAAKEDGCIGLLCIVGYCCCGEGKAKKAKEEKAAATAKYERATDFLKQRLLVAYDLTAAFEYMYDLRLVYRDIKEPQNIGFDIRGDVKVFDFGLMKSMDDKAKAPNGEYGYLLTGFTGSIPYVSNKIK